MKSVDPMAGVILSNSLSAAKAVIESRMVNRWRGDSPLLAGGGRRTVVPLFHCSGAAVSLALYGNASPTVADSWLLVSSSSGAASRHPRHRALILAGRQVVVLSLRRLCASADFILRGSRVEELLDPLRHVATLVALELV